VAAHLAGERGRRFLSFFCLMNGMPRLPHDRLETGLLNLICGSTSSTTSMPRMVLECRSPAGHVERTGHSFIKQKMKEIGARSPAR